jgi:hypothetical protein
VQRGLIDQPAARGVDHAQENLISPRCSRLPIFAVAGVSDGTPWQDRRARCRAHSRRLHPAPRHRREPPGRSPGSGGRARGRCGRAR